MRLVSISIAVVALAAATGIALLTPSGAVRAEGPVIVYTFPEDGDVLGETPTFIQMCFAEPVNNRDLPSTPVAGPSPSPTGDFKFSLVPPDRSGVGMRIVFQPDGYGLTIYPNVAGKPATGVWTLTYRLTDYEDTGDAVEGTITYTVKAGGDPVLTPTPPACTGNNTPGPTLVPIGGTPSASGTHGPSPDAGNGAEGSGDGPDILELALYTIGAAGVAAIIALIGYAVRNKIGFWLHRPPEHDGSDDHGHH